MDSNNIMRFYWRL